MATNPIERFRNWAGDLIAGKPVEVSNLDNMRAKRLTKTISYEQTLTRTKQDLKSWRNALMSAESIHFPNRTEYYRMLKDVTIDSHLTAIIEQRKNAVLCREVKFYNNDGTENEEKTKLFKAQWFIELRSLMLDAKYYGFTLVDLGPLINDKFPQIEEVQRQYVKPEFGIVVQQPSDIEGVAIDDPKYRNWNIFFGKQRDLGLLMKAAPWALWKKTVTSYWSEYCEKFGMPMRIGKTNVTDETMKTNMQNALKNMGSAAWGVLGLEDEIEILETFKVNAYDMFDKFIERANSEMSKLILSQTGTTDEKSFVGSAKVHEGILADVVEADCVWHDNNLNEHVLPVLNFHGFALDGYFATDYSESPSLGEKAEMVAAFMKGVKFNKDWMEETFDVVIDEMIESKPKEKQAGGAGAKKSKPYQDIINSYSHSCPACGGYENKDDEEFFTSAEKDDFINGVLNGTYRKDSLPIWYYQKIGELFSDKVIDGFGIPETELVFGTPDYILLQELRTSTYVFSGAKTYQQVREMSDLLYRFRDRPDLFVKEASGVFDNYNKHWLRTEFFTAKGSARSARNWNDAYDKRSVLKFLEYQTVGDARVRPSHAELDGITRPVEDSFWDLYYPPNGWRCRCTAISHDEAEVTSLKGFKQPEDVPDIFLYNPGKDRIIFSEEHPYYKVAKGDKDLALNNFNLPLA
jgi:SPP1 gp7 family putative phage head morphogenesis protein